MASSKPMLRALNGQALSVPPIWMMRQAGRYLPEYREVRAKAGDFLSLCYAPDLAAEVTLQPIRRYGFDAAILFADILLVPQALGAELWFEPGEGPRLSTTTTPQDVAQLRPTDAIDATLAPIYQTIEIVKDALPPDTALIGFAGAPWTVATYMIAGRGTPDQGPALDLIAKDRPTFQALLDRITEATISYLSSQITAGAEIIKLFDSWAGSLPADDFDAYAVAPVARIISTLKSRHPAIPIIAFPRQAGTRYVGYGRATGADCVALDNSVAPDWAAANIQTDGCVQGNLAPAHLVTGGPALVDETKRIVSAFKNGPHIFNLGHGITPDADPDNVSRMIEAVRG